MTADRFALPVALIVAVAIGVAGCTGTTPVATPTHAAPAPDHQCRPAQLLTCLMTAPSGSRETVGRDSPGTMSVRQFVDGYYQQAPPNQRDAEVALLTQLGVRSIVTEGWLANNDHVNVVLLQFGTPAAARDRVQHAELQDSHGAAKLTLDGIPGNVVGYAPLKPDAQGASDAVAFGEFGTIELDVLFASAPPLDRATLTTWLDEECTLLAGKVA